MLEATAAERLRRRRRGVHEPGRRPRQPAVRPDQRRREPGEVTYGEAFTVQPFGNTLVVKTCTGQQLYDVLNQQFNNPAAGSNRIMLPSANVRYTWDRPPRGAARACDGDP